jgi:hypothetical protein
MNTQLDLKPGAPVEVRTLWAYRCADWFKGYTFVRYHDYGRGVLAVLKIDSGVFAGCEVNYDVADVRAVEAP